MQIGANTPGVRSAWNRPAQSNMIDTPLPPRVGDAPHRFGSSSGLTQIELLVVVAIIGVLAALMLPAINATRKSAQAATCLNNLKQVGGALLRFATDHQGRLLPSKLSDEVRERETATPKPIAYWDRRLYNEGYLPGPMEDDARLHPTLFCPSLTPNGPPAKLHESYGLRDWRGTKIKNGEYIRLVNIPNPSRFFLLADSISISSGEQWYTIQSEGGNNGVHLRHYGKANTFFADGHVEPMNAEYFNALALTEPEFTRNPFKVIDVHGKLQ